LQFAEKTQLYALTEKALQKEQIARDAQDNVKSAKTAAQRTSLQNQAAAARQAANTTRDEEKDEEEFAERVGKLYSATQKAIDNRGIATQAAERIIFFTGTPKEKHKLESDRGTANSDAQSADTTLKNLSSDFAQRADVASKAASATNLTDADKEKLNRKALKATNALVAAEAAVNAAETARLFAEGVDATEQDLIQALSGIAETPSNALVAALKADFDTEAALRSLEYASAEEAHADWFKDKYDKADLAFQKATEAYFEKKLESSKNPPSSNAEPSPDQVAVEAAKQAETQASGNSSEDKTKEQTDTALAGGLATSINDTPPPPPPATTTATTTTLDPNKPNDQPPADLPQLTEKRDDARIEAHVAHFEYLLYQDQADKSEGDGSNELNTASESALAAATSAKAAKADVQPSGGNNPPEQALAIADQWHRAAEDIATYAEYLKGRYPSATPGGGQPKPKFGEELAQEYVINAYYEILKMRSDLTTLDEQVSKIFTDLNEDYRTIHVEQTDALPPFTGNAIERVSINVQRNYTPFTLTGGATVGGVSASAAPSTSGASPAGGAAGGGKGGAGGAQGGGAGGAQSGGAGGAQSGGAGIGGGAASGQGAAATAATPSPGTPSGSNDVTVILEVHRRATFNMVGGAMAIFVPTNSYSVVQQDATYAGPTTVMTGTPPVTTYQYQAQGSCNNGSTLSIGAPVAGTATSAPSTVVPYYCVEGTQTGKIQVAGMAGLEWFIWPRDYFPYHRGVGTRAENWKPALLVASSITSLGSAFVGPNIEPVNGFNFFAGVASAHQQTVSNATLQTVYLPISSSNAPPTITPATNVKWRFAFGIGFDLSVFTQLFTKASGPQLP